MRLLHITSDGRLDFTKDFIRIKDAPPYAILSHTWGEEEVLFEDLKNLDDFKNIPLQEKEGWKKIHFCVQQAKRDKLEYFWIDTCCIDKANFTELSEAINSMFRWYQNAERCYVFLADVKANSVDIDRGSSLRCKAAFTASRWFKRGWTLQELLAPHSVEFFSRDEVRLGDKESLKQIIHETTRIPIKALSGSDLSDFHFTQRISWMEHRKTTKEEDGAYCLLGILGCNLPLIYGEGEKGAQKRLLKEASEAFEDGKSASAIELKKLTRICSWLLAPDPSENYHKALKLRQADTGLWLLESAKLKIWKESAASWLWLHGIPGCGKTILSSTIIEHLLQYCQDKSHCVTTYFYFDFNDAEKRDPVLMLRSLLRQLLQRLNSLPKSVDALYTFCGDGQQPPTLHALLDVARKVIRQFTHVYIVLDALDECAQRPELMDILETVARWELGNVHVLLASRKERDIEMHLENYVEENDTICLQRDIVDRDILRYVKQRLHDDRSLAKWGKDANINQEIEAALMSGAHGMFRWAVCQLDTLVKCRNLAMLRKSLATLPQTLDQTYDRILTAIREDDCVYAIRILQWLTFSARPLFIEEVAEVVAIDIAREPAFDRDEVLIDPQDALDICSSLVKVVNTSGRRIITLAHYSVQEYLVSDRIKQGPAKQYSMNRVECSRAITKGCLAYLNHFRQAISKELLEVSALAEYSAEFWDVHLQETGDGMEEMSQLAVSLLLADTPAYLTWIRLYDHDDTARGVNLSQVEGSTAAPLYYAALRGSSTITKILLDHGADVNARGGYLGTALQAALVNGHEAVVKLLIDAGAHIVVPGGRTGRQWRRSQRHSRAGGNYHDFPGQPTVLRWMR